MKVIKKNRVITIALDEYEAYIIMTGLSEGPVMPRTALATTELNSVLS